MKLVLDTNVLIAAFIARGLCSDLLEHCAVHHDIVLSEPILSEFSRTLERKFGFGVREVRAADHLLRSRFLLVPPAFLEGPVCRDPDDDVILATALAASAAAVVTGDRDLLDLKSFRGVTILSPSEFWRFEGSEL